MMGLCFGNKAKKIEVGNVMKIHSRTCKKKEESGPHTIQGFYSNEYTVEETKGNTRACSKIDINKCNRFETVEKCSSLDDYANEMYRTPELRKKLTWSNQIEGLGMQIFS